MRNGSGRTALWAWSIPRYWPQGHRPVIEQKGGDTNVLIIQVIMKKGAILVCRERDRSLKRKPHEEHANEVDH